MVSRVYEITYKSGTARTVTTSPVTEQKEQWTIIRTAAGSNLAQRVYFFYKFHYLVFYEERISL